MMDEKLIKRLAREAGFRVRGIVTLDLHTCMEIETRAPLARFAALVAEECAREASAFTLEGRPIHPDIAWSEMSDAARNVAHTTAQHIAAAIRQRFKPTA
jgi:hypothetical protein